MTPALHERDERARRTPPGLVRAQLDAGARSPTQTADAAPGRGGRRLDLDAPTIWQRDQARSRAAWAAMANYQRWCLLRRIYSKRQVLEVMTEFWENHLHVPVHDDGVFGFRADYGKRHPLPRPRPVRPDARRRDHPPGHGDQPRQRAARPRRRPTRTSAASCSSCTPSAAATTPRTTSRTPRGSSPATASTCGRRWSAWYDTASHWTGPVQVLDFTHPNADPDGRPVAEAYLTYLAHHPADRPADRPQARGPVRLRHPVRRRSSTTWPQVYLDNDTAIVPVLRALVAHPEFAASAGREGPHPDRRRRRHLPGARRRGRAARPATTPTANAILWQTVERRPDAVRLGPARRAAGGQRGLVVGLAGAGLLRDPLHDGRRLVADGTDAPYHPAAYWVPLQPAVDALRRPRRPPLPAASSGRPAPARLVEACCLATGLTAGDHDHPQPRPRAAGMPVLLTTLLDSPDHMSR